VAIDAQLDPADSPRVVERKLKQAARKIDYWQKRAADAARYHRRRRRRELLARGFDPDQLTRCPPWPVLVQLD
jgi:hypothetical protein